MVPCECVNIILSAEIFSVLLLYTPYTIMNVNVSAGSGQDAAGTICGRARVLETVLGVAPRVSRRRRYRGSQQVGLANRLSSKVECQLSRAFSLEKDFSQENACMHVQGVLSPA